MRSGYIMYYGVESFYRKNWREGMLDIEYLVPCGDKDLWVVRDATCRFLTLGYPRDHLMQGCQLLQDPQRLLMPYMHMISIFYALASPAKRVLLLGHGAGLLISMMRMINPGVYIDVVDMHGVMFDVSKQYFSYQPNRYITEHTMDAIDFMHATNNTYDIVIVDIFDSLSMHYAVDHREFYAALQGCLAQDGTVIMNTIKKTFPCAIAKHAFSLQYGIMDRELSGNHVVCLKHNPLPKIDIISDYANILPSIGVYVGHWLPRIERLA